MRTRRAATIDGWENLELYLQGEGEGRRQAGGSAYKAVTITVSDVEEPPSAPSAPRVTATKDTGWSLDVTWSEPRNTGKPPINDYDIEYRKVKSGTDQDVWALWPHGTDDKARKRVPL